MIYEQPLLFGGQLNAKASSNGFCSEDYYLMHPSRKALRPMFPFVNKISPGSIVFAGLGAQFLMKSGKTLDVALEEFSGSEHLLANSIIHC